MILSAHRFFVFTPPVFYQKAARRKRRAHVLYQASGIPTPACRFSLSLLAIQKIEAPCSPALVGFDCKEY